MLEIETVPVVEDDEEDVEDEEDEFVDVSEILDGDLDCDGMSIFVSNTGTVEVVVASYSMDGPEISMDKSKKLSIVPDVYLQFEHCTLLKSLPEKLSLIIDC